MNHAEAAITALRNAIASPVDPLAEAEKRQRTPAELSAELATLKAKHTDVRVYCRDLLHAIFDGNEKETLEVARQLAPMVGYVVDEFDREDV